MIKPNYYHSLIVLLFLLPLAASAQPQDLFTFKRISYVNPAPDGKEAAIVTMEGVKNKSSWQWKYALYLRKPENKLSLLTTETHLVTQPAWSPDGKYIAYITNDTHTANIWMIKLANAQKSRLITFKGSISSFKWSPDGKIIAFVGTPAAAPQPPSTPVEVSSLTINARLYLLPIQFAASATPITPETISVATGFNDAGFDWSPDQRYIAFVWQPEAGMNFSCHTKIQVYDLKSRQLKSLPWLQDHYASQPLYSPDGKWLAFRTNPETENVDTNLKNNIFYLNKICMVELATLKNQCAADTENQNPAMIGWNQAGNVIYAMDMDKSNGMRIYALNTAANIPAKNISVIAGFIEPLTISMNATHTTFGFGYETITQPPEAYLAPAAGFRLIPVSHFNNPPAKAAGNTRVINWRSPDGTQIEGLLMTPAGYQPMKKYPLVVWVHGGPSGTAAQRYLGGCDEYSSTMDPSSCWINYLNAGYVVLAPNYRGSSGYGADFRAANYRDFGGGDYQDIQSGVDYVIAKEIADPKNLFLAGWSYGGYMTAWSIGQNTRYNAAIEGDGLTDLLSFSGTSDISYYTSVYLGTQFWNDPFLYVKRSPILYVKNIQTPLLIMSGQKDIRVPIEQSLELYTALKRLHKPVSMIIFPGQGHIPSDPNSALMATEEINAWFAKALRK